MKVGILVYHHVNELEVAAPAAVLSVASRLAGAAGTPDGGAGADPTGNGGEETGEPEPRIEPSTVARSRLSVQTSGGLTLTPRWAFASAPAYDALIVPGGPGIENVLGDRPTALFVDQQREGLELVAGIASGALLLGRLGFLRGRPATTHPDILERLDDYEVLETRRERLVLEGAVWTAGAIAAGAELALALVARQEGDALAARVAEHLGLEPRPD